VKKNTCLHHFVSNVEIHDCTECFIQKPSNTKAQPTIYSTYESHNTGKELVAIDPTRTFTFISNIWGGNVSDRSNTEQSYFLDLVEADDGIMAERGFTIRDPLLLKNAILYIPSFTRKHVSGNKN